MKPAFCILLSLAAAAAFMCGPDSHAAEAPKKCADLFIEGVPTKFKGTTIAGSKNDFQDAVTLQLSGAAPTATGVAFTMGLITASRLPGGKVAFTPDPQQQWGSQCIDVVAPDGRRWLFVTVSYEANYHHPNLDLVADLSGPKLQLVGFLDNSEQNFHEAQIILQLDN